MHLVVAFNSQDTWTRDQWVVPYGKEDMFADFEGWGEHVKKILSLMKKSDVWALFNHPPADTFFKGRICLLGDAAHASTPHQGAGAGMAVEDAYILANLVAEANDANDVPAAFAAYDAVRRPRTLKLVTTSKEGGQLYDYELPGVEDDLDRVKEKLSTRMDWIWNENLEEELAQAKETYRERRSRERQRL